MQKRRATRLIALVALAVVACAALVSGYYYHQPWRSGNIVMHLRLGSPSRALIDGSTSWSGPVIRALGEWNQYLPPGTVQFRVVTESTQPIGCENRVNNVYWSSRFCGRDYGDQSGWAGWWIQNGYVVETDVVFNTKPDFPWNSYRGAVRRDSTGTAVFDLRRVALHEFGHVLGLDHPFEYGQRVRSIMNYDLSVETVQRDDIAGVRELYSREGFTGSFRGSGTVSQRFATATCTWTVTYSGTARDSIIARLRQNSDGTVAGSARVSGTWSAPSGSSTNPSQHRCDPGSGSFDDEQPVSGTAANLRWQTEMDLGVGTFTGRWFVTEKYVAGTITMPYRNGSGSVRIPVRLTRTP